MRETDTPTRLKLAEWVGEYVFYGGRVIEWEHRSNGIWVLLKPVYVAKHDPDLSGNEINERAAKFDHLWVILSHDSQTKGNAKLERLKTICLRGTPYKYRRLDGSVDYAVSSIASLNTDAAIDMWEAAMAAKRYKIALSLSEQIIEAWEVKGCPLATTTQSTNTVIAIHKRCIHMFKKLIKRVDKQNKVKVDRELRHTREGLAKGFG